MTRIGLLVAVLAVGLLGTTGATCQKPTNPVVAGAINCAEEGVHNSAINIIDDVSSVLVTGDYMAGLEDLVKKFTEAAVDCAVREVFGTSEKHAQMNQLEATKAEHAKAWLASRAVTFSQTAAPPTLAGICPNGCARLLTSPFGLASLWVGLKGIPNGA